MAIKGAILGDILGSTYEFGRPKDLGWVNVPLLDEKTAHFTDDTVMTLAVKKAIIEGRDFTDTMVELGRKYPDRGYGEHLSETFTVWNVTGIHLVPLQAELRKSSIMDLAV